MVALAANRVAAPVGDLSDSAYKAVPSKQAVTPRNRPGFRNKWAATGKFQWSEVARLNDIHLPQGRDEKENHDNRAGGTPPYCASSSN